jgi:hypothetical protein
MNKLRRDARSERVMTNFDSRKETVLKVSVAFAKNR